MRDSLDFVALPSFQFVSLSFLVLLKQTLHASTILEKNIFYVFPCASNRIPLSEDLATFPEARLRGPTKMTLKTGWTAALMKLP